MGKLWETSWNITVLTHAALSRKLNDDFKHSLIFKYFLYMIDDLAFHIMQKRFFLHSSSEIVNLPSSVERLAD